MSFSEYSYDYEVNDNDIGLQAHLVSCFGADEPIEKNKEEIIDYFQKQYISNDMDTGDKSNEIGECIGMEQIVGVSGSVFKAEDVESVMLQITGVNTFSECKYDDVEIEEMPIQNDNQNRQCQLEVLLEDKFQSQPQSQFQSIQLNPFPIQFIHHNSSTTKKNPKTPKVTKKQIRKNQSTAEKEKLKEERDETKNTVKNFGKGIIIFIQKQYKLIERILVNIGSVISHLQLTKELASIKGELTRIQHLKDMWSNPIYGRQMRFISEFFLKKYTCFWIFNSRVEKVSSPLKYRLRLLEAVKNPDEFNTLKWY